MTEKECDSNKEMMANHIKGEDVPTIFLVLLIISIERDFKRIYRYKILEQG